MDFFGNLDATSQRIGTHYSDVRSLAAFGPLPQEKTIESIEKGLSSFLQRQPNQGAILFVDADRCKYFWQRLTDKGKAVFPRAAKTGRLAVVRVRCDRMQIPQPASSKTPEQPASKANGKATHQSPDWCNGYDGLTDDEIADLEKTIVQWGGPNALLQVSVCQDFRLVRLPRQWYNTTMTPKLSDDQRRAMEQQPGKPVTIEDDQTHYQYVIIPMETFQKVQALIYDDAEFDPREAYPLIDEAFGGPDGWDAPGMEMYDNYDDHRPQS